MVRDVYGRPMAVAPISGAAAAAANGLGPRPTLSSVLIQIGNREDIGRKEIFVGKPTYGENGNIGSEHGAGVGAFGQPVHSGGISDHDGIDVASWIEAHSGSVNFGSHEMVRDPSVHNPFIGFGQAEGRDGLALDSVVPESGFHFGAGMPPDLGSHSFTMESIPGSESVLAGGGGLPHDFGVSAPQEMFTSVPVEVERVDMPALATGDTMMSSMPADFPAPAAEILGGVSQGMEAIINSPIGAIGNTYLTFSLSPRDLSMLEGIGGSVENMLAVLSLKTVTIWLPALLFASICVVSTTFSFVRLLNGERKSRKQRKGP